MSRLETPSKWTGRCTAQDVDLTISLGTTGTRRARIPARLLRKNTVSRCSLRGKAAECRLTPFWLLPRFAENGTTVQQTSTRGQSRSVGRGNRTVGSADGADKKKLRINE